MADLGFRAGEFLAQNAVTALAIMPGKSARKVTRSLCSEETRLLSSPLRRDDVNKRRGPHDLLRHVSKSLAVSHWAHHLRTHVEADP